ncbi:hypothetical protein [Labilibaculum euxinus]
MSNLNYFPVVNFGVSLHVFKTHCLIKDSKGREVLEISSDLFLLLKKFSGENCLRVILNNWLMAISKTADYAEIVRKDLLQFDLLIRLKIVEFWSEYGVREINIIYEDQYPGK